MDKQQLSSLHSSKTSTKNMVLVSMFASLLAVISQISIPMPTGIPITIQSFGITLVGVVLGWKLGLYSILTYILLGAIGLPIFANFQGGLSSLAGLTGGYIIGWPIMVVACGLNFKKIKNKYQFFFILFSSITGLLIDELIGALQWYLLSGKMSFRAIIAYSIIAFIPKDIFITIIAVIIGIQIKKTLLKTGLLDI